MPYFRRSASPDPAQLSNPTALWTTALNPATSGQPKTEPDTVISGDDVWQLLFTSRSTAVPKAVMLSHHHNTYYAALGCTSGMSRSVAFERDTVFASYLPMIFHTADVLSYAAGLLGGTLVIGRRPTL